VTDYIWAQTDDLDYSHSQASLQFAHKMVKLNITAVLSSEVSLSDKSVTILSATLSNLITDGSFTLSTGAVATDEAPTKREVPLTVSSTDATQATLEDFIALPQSGLVLTITTSDNNTYQSTLNQSLTSGNAYTFTVTAKKSALDVKAEITPWITEGNEKEKEAGMIVPPIKASESWLYDLVFSDGTFMHTTESNGGALKESISLSDEQKKELRGIVYYQGDVTACDPALKNDYPGCTHGLIVALNDAGSECHWQDTGEWVYDTFQKNSDTYSQYKDVSITYTGNVENIQISYSDMLGYNNTVVLRAYNDSKNTDEKYKVIPVTNVDTYALSNKVPEGCSDWFLPCPLELALLVHQTSSITIGTISSVNTEVKDNLNHILGMLDGLGVTVSKIGVQDESYYWSSLEVKVSYYNTTYIYASILYKYYDYYGLALDYKYYNTYNTRPICAY
jgi:hypothetical protein